MESGIGGSHTHTHCMDRPPLYAHGSPRALGTRTAEPPHSLGHPKHLFVAAGVCVVGGLGHLLTN